MACVYTAPCVSQVICHLIGTERENTVKKKKEVKTQFLLPGLATTENCLHSAPYRCHLVGS